MDQGLDKAGSPHIQRCRLVRAWQLYLAVCQHIEVSLMWPAVVVSAAHLVARELVHKYTAVQLLDNARVLPDDLPEVRHHGRRFHHVLHPQPWARCSADQVRDTQGPKQLNDSQVQVQLCSCAYKQCAHQ